MGCPILSYSAGFPREVKIGHPIRRPYSVAEDVSTGRMSYSEANDGATEQNSECSANRLAKIFNEVFDIAVLRQFTGCLHFIYTSFRAERSHGVVKFAGLLHEGFCSRC